MRGGGGRVKPRGPAGGGARCGECVSGSRALRALGVSGLARAVVERVFGLLAGLVGAEPALPGACPRPPRSRAGLYVVCMVGRARTRGKGALPPCTPGRGNKAVPPTTPSQAEVAIDRPLEPRWQLVADSMVPAGSGEFVDVLELPARQAQGSASGGRCAEGSVREGWWSGASSLRAGLVGDEPASPGA